MKTGKKGEKYGKRTTKISPDTLDVQVDLEHKGDLWDRMPNDPITMKLIILQGLAMMIAREMDLAYHTWSSDLAER